MQGSGLAFCLIQVGAGGKRQDPYTRIGNEIDLLLDHGRSLQPVALKSGQTPSGDHFNALRKWLALAGPRARHPAVIYGGSRSLEREGLRLLPWSEWPEGAVGR